MIFPQLVFILQYERDGYLVVEDVFDAAKVKELSDAADDFVKRLSIIYTWYENMLVRRGRKENYSRALILRKRGDRTQGARKGFQQSRLLKS